MKSLSDLAYLISKEYHEKKILITNPKKGQLKNLYLEIVGKYHGLYREQLGCLGNFLSALHTLKPQISEKKPVHPPQKQLIPIQGSFNFS
jgi:hypothetical protein